MKISDLGKRTCLADVMRLILISAVLVGTVFSAGPVLAQAGNALNVTRRSLEKSGMGIVRI